MRNRQLIQQIRQEFKKLRKLNDDDLRSASAALRYRIQASEKSRDVLRTAFALVSIVCQRQLCQTPYDVQLLCGLHMAAGRIAEMKTGEGKTLTAALPAYFAGLHGKGVHVVTFNDYLANRDAEFLRPVFRCLGLSVGVLKENLPNDQRRQAYAADITYGSAKEFGFDFLRDRLATASANHQSTRVMRGLHCAIVDEADSILIDEARTPLIIGVVNEHEEVAKQGCYRWAAEHAPKFSERNDFRYDQAKQKVSLNSAGLRKLRLLPQSSETKLVSIRQLYEFIETAIKVRRDFHLDKNYAVVDGDIVILDEFTGRPAEGRQWQRGVHQAVQAKEKLDITAATHSAASITIQTFFKLYKKFCGMTGTAWTSRRELRKVYKKKVVQIPTHRPVVRKQLPVRIFPNLEDKFRYVASKTSELRCQGRSILIGSRSVRASEQISKKLNELGIPHVVLNAKHLESEANIVEQAGQPQQVTVATNMAGRGTDIKLHPSVKKSGGLHVILTEIHFSQRIDWQLIGRASRQGDPGSYQICISLEDEILEAAFGVSQAQRLRKKYSGVGVIGRSLYRLFEKAQQKMERRHLVDRLIVQKQDEERKKASFDTGQDPYLTSIVN